MARKDPKCHYIQHPEIVTIKFIVVHVKIFSCRDRHNMYFQYDILKE